MPATHFADRLLDAIAAKGAPVCVGIDPVADRLPAELRGRASQGVDAALDAICEFTSILIDAVADHVPAVKFQSACFERYRAEGVDALYSLIREAQDQGLIVILDAKRGDIGISAEHYAAGIFDPPRDESGVLDTAPATPDALTVNAYLGIDSLQPFCAMDRGTFALVRTSNSDADLIQQARLQLGLSVAEHLASVLAEFAQQYIGTSGYSSVGAVVGATVPDEMKRLRELMPRCIFLVPGYGAQGGAAEDVRQCFNASDGKGALISASRSVIYAFEPDAGPDVWPASIAAAAVRLAEDVSAIVPDAAR